jgi:outer membrane lipase/esterase
MTFSSKAATQGRNASGGIVGALTSRVAALVIGAVALTSLGVISACGGSTSQLDPFVPKRLLVFGDDNSALTQTGRKYGVNGLNATTGNLDCASEPIWVQSLASIYGFEFAECNPTAVEPHAFMRAFAGAEGEVVAAQVVAQVAAGGFRDKDLATVLVGTNDILDLYNQYPGRSVDGLLAESRARGVKLALVVNRLVGLGVKVIVSDVPDVGTTPYALAQKALDPTGLDRAALMSQMTSAFNEQLGVNVLLDGRFVGLMQAELRFKAISTSPASFGLSNISEGVCTVALPNCTTNTLVTGAVTSTYLWADDFRLAAGGHSQLASLAVDRARRNPF